jgi:hypothetical protein
MRRLSLEQRTNLAGTFLCAVSIRHEPGSEENAVGYLSSNGK